MRNIIIVFHSFKPSLYFLIVSLLTFVFYQHRLDYIFVCSLHCWSRNRHWEIQFNRQSGFKQAKNVPIRAVKRTEFVLWKHQITLSINYLIYYHKMFGMTFFIVFPGWWWKPYFTYLIFLDILIRIFVFKEQSYWY